MEVLSKESTWPSPEYVGVSSSWSLWFPRTWSIKLVLSVWNATKSPVDTCREGHMSILMSCWFTRVMVLVVLMVSSGSVFYGH